MCAGCYEACNPLRGHDGYGAIEGARCDHLRRLLRDRLGSSAASVHSGFSGDVCAAEGSSLTGVAHPSAITSSASWRGRSNISSTERCERSMPSKHLANLCVKRISIATEPTLRNEPSVSATTTVGNRVVCNGRLHGVQCYLYFIKGCRRPSLI